MTGAAEWRGDVGDVWAEEWERTDRSLAPVNEGLVAEAGSFLRGLVHPLVLDVGCGAGATSLALADALPGADITGLDLSEALIAIARERGAGRPNLCFEQGDAAFWSPQAAAFDLIVSRHGVMFFADPVAAFAHLRTLAKPGGGLVFSCFRGRGENDWVEALRPVFARYAPAALAAPDPPVGPFALADPSWIESILREAGFAPPRIVPLDFAFVVGSGTDPVADAIGYFRRIGPFAALLRSLERSAGEGAIEQLAAIVGAHRTGDRISFRAAAWIVRSARP